MAQTVSDTDLEGLEELVLAIMRTHRVLSCHELVDHVTLMGGPRLEPDELEYRLAHFLTQPCSCVRLDTYTGEYLYNPRP